MINTMLKTSIGDFFFDAVFKTEHTANMIITEHPIQTGAPVSDHAYMEPVEISVEIGMSDVNGEGTSLQMYQQLKALMNLREPFTVVTRLESYSDMLIASLSVPDDYTTMHSLKAGIVFKQVRVVSVATVEVQQTVSSSKNDSSSGTASARNDESNKKTSAQKIIEGIQKSEYAKMKLEELKKGAIAYSNAKANNASQKKLDEIISAAKKNMNSVNAKLQTPMKTTKAAITCTESTKSASPGTTAKTVNQISAGLLANKIDSLTIPKPTANLNKR